MNEPTETQPVLYLWVAVGSRDTPPTRIKVEACVSCGSLVPVSQFDVHGRWHRNVEL